MLLSLSCVAPSSYPRTCPQVWIPAMLAFLPNTLWLVPYCPCWLSSLSAVLGFSRPGVCHVLKAMLDASALNRSVFILRCNFQGHLRLVIFPAGTSHFYSCRVLTPVTVLSPVPSGNTGSTKTVWLENINDWAAAQKVKGSSSVWVMSTSRPPAWPTRTLRIPRLTLCTCRSELVALHRRTEHPGVCSVTFPIKAAVLYVRLFLWMVLADPLLMSPWPCQWCSHAAVFKCVVHGVRRMPSSAHWCQQDPPANRRQRPPSGSPSQMPHAWCLLLLMTPPARGGDQLYIKHPLPPADHSHYVLRPQIQTHEAETSKNLPRKHIFRWEGQKLAGVPSEGSEALSHRTPHPRLSPALLTAAWDGGEWLHQNSRFSSETKFTHSAQALAIWGVRDFSEVGEVVDMFHDFSISLFFFFWWCQHLMVKRNSVLGQLV